MLMLNQYEKLQTGLFFVRDQYTELSQIPSSISLLPSTSTPSQISTPNPPVTTSPSTLPRPPNSIISEILIQTYQLSRVEVIGNWNNWAQPHVPCFFNETKKIWESDLKLPPGKHAFKYIVDGYLATSAFYPSFCNNENTRAHQIVILDNEKNQRQQFPLPAPLPLLQPPPPQIFSFSHQNQTNVSINSSTYWESRGRNYLDDSGTENPNILTSRYKVINQSPEKNVAPRQFKFQENIHTHLDRSRYSPELLQLEAVDNIYALWEKKKRANSLTNVEQLKCAIFISKTLRKIYIKYLGQRMDASLKHLESYYHIWKECLDIKSNYSIVQKFQMNSDQLFAEDDYNKNTNSSKKKTTSNHQPQNYSNKNTAADIIQPHEDFGAPTP